MESNVRYADLWKFLRTSGFECDTLAKNPQGNNLVRVCEHAASGARITLADRPAEEIVHPQTLAGVRLQLDNFGVIAPAEFDRWVERRTRANSETVRNGLSTPKPETLPRVTERQT